MKKVEMLDLKWITGVLTLIFAGVMTVEADWRTEGMLSSEWATNGISTFQMQIPDPGEGAVDDLPSAPAAASRSMATLPFISSEVSEMAATLEYDPELIYEFVRNDIAYDHQWMWLRSAERTLVDRWGSAADQAELLVKLLQASGYMMGYDLYYARGILELPLDGNDGYNLRSWLGVSSVAEAASLMDQMSWPRAVTTNSLGFPYYWVTIYLDGQWQHLNPSIKPHDRFVPEDVYASAGYSRSSLLSTAGGTGDTNEISGVDESGVRTHLNALREAFCGAIESNHPNSHVEDVLGGKRIIPEEGFGGARGTIWEIEYWTSLAGRARPHYIQFGDVRDELDNPISFSSTALGTDRLTIEVDSSGTNGTLYVNDTAYFTGMVAQANGDSRIAFIAPQGYWYSTNWNFYTQTYRLDPDSTNAVFYSLGHCDNRGMVCGQSEQLSEGLNSGTSTVSMQRLSRHLIGNQWISQKNQATALIDNLFDDLVMIRYTLGLLGSASSGYYIDMKHVNHQPLYTGSLNEGLAINRTPLLFSSAIEHGVLEQAQPGSDAVSSVKVLALAGADTQTIFRVTSNNWESVETNLVNYSSGEKLTLENRLQSNDTILILHEDGDTVQNSWTGNAHVAVSEESFAASISGRNGGINTDREPIDVEKYRKILEAAGFTPAEIRHILSKEPVDMTTGAYIFDRDDLRIDGPLDLTLSRHYSSLQRNVQTPVGYGWTHSFDIHAREHSSPQMGLGLRSPEDAASAALGLCIIKDLLEHEDTAKGWLTAALTAQWMMDQLTDNAVTITIGQKGITFIKQPDGSYTPPPGMAVSLTKTNNVYVMSERNAHTYTFNTDNLIAEIRDPDSNTVTFAYNAQTNLQSVTSSFGPSMSFSYTSGLLTSVSDSAGRSVEYEYDTSGNLTNFVDAEDFEWGVSYGDTNLPHCITGLTDPEGITTIQNFYNSIAQVTNQISAAGHPWNFYFTGTRNVEEDPYGNQTAYYIDDHGRTWSVENALSNRTYTFYDGQNHITNTIDERGITNIFVYDVDHNLLSATEAVGTPEERTIAYSYDSLHRLTSVTNALGHTTRYAYDAEHHLTGITNALDDAVAFEIFPNGLLKKTTEDGGRITSHTYDANGNPDTVISTDAGTVDFDYNARGELTDLEDARNQSTQYTYDLNGRILTTEFSDGSTVSNAYYDNGLLKETTDGRGQTVSKVWNNAYKLQSITYPDGGIISNTYDAADRLIATIDQLNNLTTYQLDSLGQILSVSSVYSVVENSYDPSGNTTNSTVDPSGLNLWASTEYDSLNRPVSVSSALSAVENSYDLLGRITNRIDEVSNHWKTEYDALEPVVTRFSTRGQDIGYELRQEMTRCFLHSELQCRATVSGVERHSQPNGGACRAPDHRDAVVCDVSEAG